MSGAAVDVANASDPIAAMRAMLQAAASAALEEI